MIYSRVFLCHTIHIPIKESINLILFSLHVSLLVDNIASCEARELEKRRRVYRDSTESCPMFAFLACLLASLLLNNKTATCHDVGNLVRDK